MLKKGEYKWYAVYVKSRAEKKLYSELVRMGVEAYLPLVSKKKQWSDRVKIVEEPLLRGYLFVKVSTKEYFDVLNVNGAVAYVAFLGKPAEIQENQIYALRMFQEKVNEGVQVTRDVLNKGQKVKVVLGLLAGMYGEIVEFRGKKRIVLRFDNLGYSVFTDVTIDLIERVEPIGK